MFLHYLYRSTIDGIVSLRRYYYLFWATATKTYIVGQSKGTRFDDRVYKNQQRWSRWIPSVTTATDIPQSAVRRPSNSFIASTIRSDDKFSPWSHLRPILWLEYHSNRHSILFRVYIWHILSYEQLCSWSRTYFKFHTPLLILWMIPFVISNSF